MDHAIDVLNNALNQQILFLGHPEPGFLVELRNDNHIGNTGLVFQAQEDESLGGSRTLADYHRSSHPHSTPVRELPELADELGLGAVLVKDESDRLGLPAFKVLGASWAIENDEFRRVFESDDAIATRWPLRSVSETPNEQPDQSH